MSFRIKITLRILLALLLVAGITSAVLNQKAISEAKQENQNLAIAAAESQHLETENKQLSATSPQPGDVEGLKQVNSELPKLRNEVRQLRRQTEELEKLKAENVRLLALQKGVPDKLASTALPEGFIPRAAMVDAGQATPEATVQTMFWAMCQGDFKRMAECSVRGDKNLPQGGKAQGDLEERIRKEIIKEMSKFTGLSIAEKKIISDNEVELGVRSSSVGAILKFPLKRVGADWKINQ